ncbi:hypothetical protein niasHT_025803 [Heterodera trifolii]|uniref:Uncharacterized protein n=1 Tax=Heterodera trifolii TaxID=157864 RepID=A0ABD2KSR3_9BILA
MEPFTPDAQICFKIDNLSIFAQLQVGTKKRHPNILEHGQLKIKCYLYSVNIRDPTDMAPLATTTRKTFRIILKCDSKTKETPWSFTIEAMLVFITVNDFGEGPGSYVFTHNFYNTGTVSEKLYDNFEPIFFEASSFVF